MSATIGIRLEDKNIWERRAPLTPEDVKQLKAKGVDIVVQSSKNRTFTDEEYRFAGARVEKEISNYPIMLAIKEIPKELFVKGRTYIFFSHTIKGQKYNMEMLKKMMELECQLIDYERVVDEKNRRLIFFGKYAGVAGMIDSLWALGKRLKWEGINTPFTKVKLAHQYKDLHDAKVDLLNIAGKIKKKGIPQELRPLVVGFAGYGNVSKGAQEILDLFNIKEIESAHFAGLTADNPDAKDTIFKVVFKEEHMVVPVSPGATFELQDYYDHPEHYRGVFEKYLDKLTLLMNCIYWDKRYPRVVTKDWVKASYSGGKKPKLRVIGDVSCDIEGGCEPTVQCTKPDEPVFVFDPDTGKPVSGWKVPGPVIMAVDNLPCELPKEASAEFSRVLRDFVEPLAKVDFSLPFEQLGLPPALKRAVILHHGKFTPDYKYMEKYV
jgi:alanine dehydrogenase